MPRPRGKCGKIIYFNELEAKIELARQQRRDVDVRRVQPCNICHGLVFHLTSQDQRTKPPKRRSKKKTRSRAPQSIDEESSRDIA